MIEKYNRTLIIKHIINLLHIDHDDREEKFRET